MREGTGSLAEERIQRRLAAILVADVVGYSRLMEADEVGTRERLRSLHAELINPRITADGGRVVKTTGDGILVEFSSAVDAVRNALAIQSAMAGRNAELPEEQRLVFRVGINLGDVIIEEDDIHGDGVNVAARLEGLCGPGEVYLSGTVHEHVAGKLSASFDDLGEQKVKNISKQVKVYRARNEAGEEIASTGVDVRSPVPNKPSIAVLPFTNMSGDPEQEYFSDGITEDLITALCRVRSFRVVARNSTFSYKGTSPDLRQVARELAARYVIEGSVRRAGNRLRITVQLIDGASGNHIWAERYDRSLEDIFALQDELTLTLVGAIEPELGRFEQQAALARSPESLGTWELYQRGMSYLSSTSLENVREARRLFERTMKADPNFGPAYAGYAETYALGELIGIEDQDHAEALRAAQKAVELDPSDAIAHHELGRVHWADRRHDAAISEFENAIELNPSLGVAHNMIARCLSMSGRAHEAIPHVHQAILLSPRDPHIPMFHAALAHAHLFLGEHEDAVFWALKSIQHPRVAWPNHAFLVAALAHLSRNDEAGLAMAEMVRFRPGISVAFVRTTLPLTDLSYMDHLLDGLRKAGLPE